MSDMSFISLILGASAFVKVIMFGLLVLSISTWAIIFSKLTFYNDLKKSLSRFEVEFTEDFDNLVGILAKYRDSTLGITRVLRSGMREYVKMAENSHATPEFTVQTSERAMQMVYNQECQKLSTGLPFLATVGSLSVYIGLLGTVWGVITAFRSLGGTAHVTLAMVAPGIAEALIATALGLIAAIPAVFAHNRFKSKMAEVAATYNTYAEAFLSMIARKVVESKKHETTK